MTTLAGRTLGRYRLEGLIGRGGMAEVYRATDTLLTRTVAVKVILAAFAGDPLFSERFFREARLVASLEHPNILPIFDVGEEGHFPYLVMPYLDGGSLKDRMLGKPIPIREALDWIGQLAEALDAAHAAGILHRDVKPANVLIGKRGQLVLADFGIAKMVEADTSLTGTGVVLGTPIYISPEQAQGQPVTAASDRYALAILAWELLTGHPPFQGDSAFALMNQHVTAPVPAISATLPGLPRGLDPVFSTALSKKPTDRPATCRLFAEQVARCHPSSGAEIPSEETVRLAASLTRPTTATTPSPAPPTAPAATAPPATPAVQAPASRRALVLAAGAVVLTAAVAAILYFRPAPREDSASRVPARPAVPASSAALPLPTPIPPARDAVETPPQPKVVELKPPPVAAPSAPDRVAHPLAPPVDARPTEPARPTSPPAVAEAEGPEEAIAAARKRLERAFAGGGRVGRADFDFALREARKAVRDRPDNGVARFLEIYSQGGLDYIDGKNAAAGQALVEAFRSLPRAAAAELRPLRSIRSPEAKGGPPAPLELALAYGDARGEAGALIDEALKRNPGGMRPLLARAHLRRLQGRDDEAFADALRAWEARPQGTAGAAAAEFLGESCARRKEFPEAVRWYRLAATPPNPLTGHAAMQAAKILRERLQRPDEANALFRVACLAGNEKACEEAPAPPRGFRRRTKY